MTFNVNYTWSHSIDDGSTWHSGATSANGAGAGDGYTTDVLLAAASTAATRSSTSGSAWLRTISWELPFYKSQDGILGHILGGWQYNGIVSWQTGAHWEPWTFTNGGDPVGSIGVFTGPEYFRGGMQPGPDRQQASALTLAATTTWTVFATTGRTLPPTTSRPVTISGRTAGVRPSS